MRNKAINALLEMGMPADIIGFEFIVDILELFCDDSLKYGNLMNVYKLVAEKRNTRATCVERNVRHAFSVVFTKGNLEAVKKYLSLTNRTNGNLLHVLYLRLEEEEKVDEN